MLRRMIAFAGWPTTLIILAAIGSIIAGAVLAHGRAIADLKASSYAAGYAAAEAKWKTEALKATVIAHERKAQAERAQGAITQEALHEVTEARNDVRRAADALRVRWQAPAGNGQGVASRADLPRVPGAAGRADESPAVGHAALVAVPAAELLDHAEQCQLDRSTLTTLQAWVAQQHKASQPAAASGE